jgi:hypothetical protein
MVTDVSEGYAAFSPEGGRCLPSCLARPSNNSSYERVFLQMMVGRMD